MQWETQPMLDQAGPITKREMLQHHAKNIVDQFKQLAESAKGLTPQELALVCGAIVLTIGGMAGQVITLNLWLHNFQHYANPFTVLTLTGTMMATLFSIAAGVRIVILKKRFRFMFTRAAIIQNCLIGLCNALNGVMLVFATQNTPEILQALLTATQIFWTLLFSKFMLRDDRNYLSPLIFVSFLLCVGGIILPMAPMFKSEKMTLSVRMWTVMFAASMIPAAVFNVIASQFMRRFTDPNECIVSSPAMTPKRSSPNDPQGYAAGQSYQTVNAPSNQVKGGGYSDLEDASNFHGAADGGKYVSDDTTVKLIMLALSGVWQVIWFICLLPTDALPWFGSSPKDIHGTGKHLSLGYQCVFNVGGICPTNFHYFIYFNMAYLGMYLGGSYLNHYSAGLNCMIMQLAAPVAAIILISHPAWNVNKGDYTVGTAVGGIILLTIGSLLYSSWEEGSRNRDPASPTQEQQQQQP